MDLDPLFFFSPIPSPIFFMCLSHHFFSLIITCLFFIFNFSLFTLTKQGIGERIGEKSKERIQILPTSYTSYEKKLGAKSLENNTVLSLQ
jgi:hypothetical protein